MPVMRIRVVRMRVIERFMPVHMGMPDIGWRRFGMLVLMMFVMRMLVAVLQKLVGVRVFMALGQVQPDANAHQRGGRQ